MVYFCESWLENFVICILGELGVEIGYDYWGNLFIGDSFLYILVCVGDYFEEFLLGEFFKFCGGVEGS